MKKDVFQSAMEAFDVPEEFYEIAGDILTEEEIRLIALMGRDAFDETALKELITANNLAENAEAFLFRCYSRAVLEKKLEGTNTFYVITCLQKRFPYFAQYEPESWAKVPREMKKKMNDAHLRYFVAACAPDVQKQMRGEATGSCQGYITLADAEEMIDRQAEPIYVLPCDCKSMMFYHDKPTDVCISFGTEINSAYDRGHGRVISKEEAKALLRDCNKKGLMQNGEEHAICNCDGLCCYPIQMAKEIGSRHVYPKSNYSIQWDESKCINCGRCVKLCNFEAFFFDGEKKVHYDPQKCWQCTICAPNCPKNAIGIKRL